MPALSRHGSTRLLRQVNNKPHATEADHHDALPTPPATNSTRSSGSLSKAVEDDEDIYADPQSSDDEKAPAFVDAPNIDGAQDELPAAQWQNLPARSYGASPEKASTAVKAFARPSLRSPESTRSKRSNDSDGQGSSDNDAPLFSSQGSSKRAKPTTGNIHAAARKPKQMYGRKFQRTQSASQKDFKKPAKAEKKAKEPEQPKFALAKVPDVFRFGATQVPVEFKTPDEHADAGARDSLSPSLSSLSSVPDSPGVEEIAKFDLPKATPYCATVKCDICGDEVDKLLKENFEDQYTGGRTMTFRWQQRFCRHHKEQSAKDLWDEKGYPDIDWTGLERRMRKFDKHLRDVLSGKVVSQWKQDLQRDLHESKTRAKSNSKPKPRSKSTGAPTVEGDQEEAESRAQTGYYGPRGEKVMTDHIVTHLADDLRERASKDKLVAASGVKGGVSGFVHGVLVPELACCLIKEDLTIGGDEAKAVMEKSADMGVLLHPDLDEDVTGQRDEDEMEVEG